MFKDIINRPVLATVISSIIVLLGLISLSRLPITQFPDIAPPTVYVSGSYPGGNSESVLRSVIIPLEEAINGVEGMEYMTSSASNDGMFSTTIVFKLGINPDQAAVNVQNRVAQVSSQVPPEVLRAGISTSKRQNGSILTFNIVSNDSAKYDELFLQNYASINLVPALRRIQGVGGVMIFGVKDYSMRIWLDPQKMTVHNLIPADIEAAIQNASFEASPGKLGAESDAPMQYTVRYKGRLSAPEEFERIVLKANSDGSMLRLKDVARVEFGASFYDSDNKQDGQPAVTLMIQQSSGSNANKIEIAVREVLEQSAPNFPPGISYSVVQSAKEQLDDSISQVIKTLIEAFLLVVLVVFIFLQNLRATLIPTIAVPVSIIGTFFFLQLTGFSINILTLFALVLAIGIVIDDAIVVVEAVHTKMSKEGVDSKTATQEAMKEITGAIISITLVMCAVFLPIGFMEGSAGVFYKQFAFTLVFAVLISAVNALTLSPALCALFLKPSTHNGSKNGSFKERFFGAFDAGLGFLTNKYLNVVSFSFKRKWPAMCMFACLTLAAFWMMNRAPKDFVPTEDDGFITYSLALPSGTNLQHTTAVINRIDSALRVMPEVRSVTSISGINMLSNSSGPSYAGGFICLKKKKERGEIQDMDLIIEAMTARLENLKAGELSLFRNPPVDGFGAVSGAELILQDRTGGSIDQLAQVAKGVISKMNQEPSVSMAFTSFRSDFPQFEIEIDEDKTYQLGTTPREVLNTLQTFYGGSQAGDFIRFGKLYYTNMKAEGKYRKDENSLSQVYLKSSTGEMIPVSNLVRFKKIYGPESIDRYNLYNSVNISILPKPGYGNGALMSASEKILKENLPTGYGYEWSGLSREEKSSAEQMFFIFGLCLLFTYFLLAAQYESYILPLAVILSISTGLLGVFIAIKLCGITNNIYVQIGLIMLIGLLARNAILIVEFAKQAREHGMSIAESALEGARQRLRPILMTSLTFIIGLIPLAFATGPSAIGNRSISISAIGGMLSGVVLGLMFIPVLYIFFQSLHERISGSKNTI
jgi:hydrophobic/amphiphilic exporter-1 (mainly G- bacteria), HAE1 family